MKTIHSFNLNNIDSSWLSCLENASNTMPQEYLIELIKHNDWLPGKEKIFNAFSIPLTKIKFILMGESPYPRAQSANGYAFWDNQVESLWSPTGFSKAVNRATSLRNLIKMMLVAENKLNQDTSQPAIAAIDKSNLVKDNQALFQNFLQKGFLLLNATPVLTTRPPAQDARAWQPFIHEILQYIAKKCPEVKVLLFGNIAQTILPLLPSSIQYLKCEHPYNHSFIHNQQVLGFFRPLHLIRTS